MKRLFLGVFGGFCAVIILIGIFNFYHFSAIHTYQEEVVKADRVAQRLQEHKEQFQVFGQHHQLFDSVALSLPGWQKNNQRFWREIMQETFRNQQSLRAMELPVYDGFSGRRQMAFIGHAEQEILLSASRIGFKEEGLIGKMRGLAHFMESHYPQHNERLLSLRRHEKDFLMRIDPIYAGRLHTEMAAWQAKGNIPKDLTGYVAYFDTLTSYYLAIFQQNKSGQYHNWIQQFEELQEGVRKQRSLLLAASFTASSKAQTFNFILNSIAVLLAVCCTIIFTRRFSRQVKQLQQTMAQYIATNYQFTEEAALRIPKNDFGKITLHFLQLTRKIRTDMQLLEDRVQRRTKSLELKNQQLELQHREIMGSLRYAQDLQQSLLVSRSKMLRSFREAWVYYQPKNLVGGDFYWMKEVRQKDEHIVYFALADCTGHGVPGALLSVMGMNTLDELIDSGLRQPALMLNELRALVSRRLNTHEDKRYDGMDLALFAWDKTTDTLTFSGAQMPLWLLRGGKLIETVGQRMPIGYTYFEVNSFENCVIRLQPGDKLVLFSDGVIDQFGGLNNKKLGRKALREWLKANAGDTSPSLFSRLVQQFECWKGNGEQTDDCTLLLLEPELRANLEPEIFHHRGEQGEIRA
jgi:sigma-B regulation protein RsbU (phosphoserine phosphatase)